METTFRKMRSKRGEVWQLGCYESPLWSEPKEGGPPFRPRMAVCWSVRTDRLETSSSVTGEPGPEAFREAVTLAARAWRLRPERIEVADARLAEALNGSFSAEGVTVEVRDGLPELRAALEERTRALRRLAPPAALSVPGVTVERLATFAGAAARFAAAAPWRYLESDDLLILESPGLPAELRRARVFGPPFKISGVLFQPGEPGQEQDPGDEEESWELDWEDEGGEDEGGWIAGLLLQEGLWNVSLVPLSWLPPEDIELWLRHGLPFADAKAYPLASRRLGADVERPPAPLLSWFEVVLDALAATTEEEMDSGHWEKEVVTAEGPVRIVLSLPGVLEPAYADSLPAEDEDSGVSPSVRLADELACEALEAPGRRQIQLARRAVALWPGCIDAWLVLARRALDLETARDLYAEAVAAGEPLLGEMRGMRGIGRHNDRPLQAEELRTLLPYLWARTGLAESLWGLGDREEAVGHFREILAIDPDDCGLVRYSLAYALLALGRDGEVEELLSRYMEIRADWYLLRALLTFRREGDSPAARRQLAAGLEEDHRLAKQLLDPAQAPPAGWRRYEIDASLGFREVWADTPGALEWLQAHSVPAATGGPARKKKRKDKRGSRRRRR
jgi:tetratricopeptide (TPR) repeat protein